ncbi:DUF2267 domain-containing protein [Stappia sp.]|uniref:DUF2267 domain-containing protein n=1 Tax=Stappia sp. TaxID=1870903 RepID=UPI0032D98F1A
MPMPREYQIASAEFERLLNAARDEAGLTTRNQAWTMVQAVFRVFRRRLAPEDAIRFAQALPALARALFVADWEPGEEQIVAFADRETMTREAQSLRKHHNFAPDSCIADVAVALRACVDGPAFDRVLARLPAEARDFWAVPPASGGRGKTL